MTKDEFRFYRKKLGKTQQELATILGMSLKTIHSYEQGWRAIPQHVARYFLFLVINQRNDGQSAMPCWEKKVCPKKERCPAWEFQCGHLCWFIHGTLCTACDDSCKTKLDSCKNCDIYKSLVEDK
ncbi:MAG: helix-turn-helix domain-containing protein [Desulfobulbaceae bacterium]|jgi:hypothetical protein|nr:helix-turn-helix domain-containing protein [Desulfobulbaceae bacterium]